MALKEYMVLGKELPGDKSSSTMVHINTLHLSIELKLTKC